MAKIRWSVPAFLRPRSGAASSGYIRNKLVGVSTSLDRDTALSNATVATCVGLIARTIAQLEFYAPENESVTNLLKEPLPGLSTYDFLHALAYDLMSDGNSYLYASRTDSGNIVALSSLEATTVLVNSRNPQTHPTPVSYTHLTLPTICSV